MCEATLAPPVVFMLWYLIKHGIAHTFHFLSQQGHLNCFGSGEHYWGIVILLALNNLNLTLCFSFGGGVCA